jgi:ParB-like chromosome segregation protein Spo0J
VTSLVANPRNPNKHSDKQVALLAKVIRHQGWRAPITVSKRSGFIVTGHGRLAAAILLQVEQVPIDEQDFATEADEWAHLVADNRIAELADADRGMIADLLGELDAGGLDMDLTGFDMEALEELMEEKETIDEADEAETKPKQSDDDYSLFELVMLHENKLKLIDALNLIKQKSNLETNELAIMTLISSYDSK